MELMEDTVVEGEDGEKAENIGVEYEEITPLLESIVMKRRRKHVVKRPMLKKSEKAVRDKSKHNNATSLFRKVSEKFQYIYR